MLAASPALAADRETPEEPRQILRPLPLDIVDVVWQADAREAGLTFRLYREDGPGRLTLLSEIPAQRGRHSYRQKDLPPGERQRYVLRLLDAQGRENPLRTIELIGYRTIDPEAPPRGQAVSYEPTLPSRAAVLPRPAASRAFLDPPAELAASRLAEPPDPPPDAARR